MSSDLERRLEGLLAEAPEPDPGAGEKALHRALRALQPAPSPHRGLRTAIVAFAVVAVLLAIAAGSLAAAGGLHISLGTKPKTPSAQVALTLPKGANGIAVVVDGRLSVVTRAGFGMHGLPVSSAALSPHALYVAAGIGNSLVAMKPDQRQAWSHPAGGRVVAIAWAPDGLEIAYVVRRGSRLALHVIYGNGKKDTTIDRSVRAVRPSWRADSLAFAYVGAGGKAIVYDLSHRSRSVVGTAAPVTRLVFAPTGRTLVLATPDAAVVGAKTVANGEVEAIGWFHDRPAVALASRRLPVIRSLAPHGRTEEDFIVPGRVVGITGGLIVTRTRNSLLAGWREKRVTTLLTVSPPASVDDLAIG
jgi:hypothetical protein